MRATRSLCVALSASVLFAACTVSILDGAWRVECGAVLVEDCAGVALVFVNNLAGTGEGIRQESGGVIAVSSTACPGLPAWAAPGTCWRATAKTTITARACMIIARQKDPQTALLPFGQVGGDKFAGIGPELGTTPC